MLFLTFSELSGALAPLHMYEKPHLDSLHDVWKQGAPSPNSIILNPKGYDERKTQEGNMEARLILPLKLTEWIVDVSAKRGHPYTPAQALAMFEGIPRYTP